jgi:F1F0 ATPase subunit 2
MTTDISPLLMAFAFGAAIGFFYFVGLWWTLKRLPERRRPGLWVVSSFFIRTAVSVFAFYLVMDGHWQRLLASLLGFVVVRIVLVRRLSPAKAVIESKPVNSDLGFKEIRD